MAGQGELNNIRTIAAKEFHDNILSKRFILLGIFYMGMAFLLMCAIVADYYYTKGNIAAGGFKPSAVLSLMNALNIIIALLAVIVSSDSISLERKDRTVYQLLSKPVQRSSVILGKYLGSLGVVSVLFVVSAAFAYIATVILTGVYPALGDIPVVIAAIISMLFLLAVYVAIGLLISTVTRNPILSILGSVMAWMALFFSSFLGNMLGSLSLSSSGQILLFGDPFAQYPIYAKALVWIDPLSHGILDQLLAGDVGNAVASGLPLWANIIVLIVYTGILITASVGIFNRLDL